MDKGFESLIKPGMAMRVIQQSKYDFDFWNGRLLIWEQPVKGEEYILGVDTSEGVKQDRSVCQVIQKGNLIHPDIQVAEFACDFLDPIDFAACVNTIGRFYADPDNTEAFCTIETNNPAGASVLNSLRSKHDYTNLFIRKDYEKRENLWTTKYGWHTTRNNRGLIIARALHAFQYGDLVVNSPFLLDEMADFESNHDIAQAKVKAHKGHDDRILALLVGYWGGHDEEFLSGDDIGEQRRLRTSAQTAQQQLLLQVEDGPKKPSWQASAVSAKRMADLADDWLLSD